MSDPARKFFPADFTERERAIFEAGVALGAVYHQLAGLPVAADPSLLSRLGEALSEAFTLQPFKAKVKVSFNLERFPKVSEAAPYGGYCALRGEMLDVTVETVYGRARVRGRLRYVEELGYPLMYVEEASP